MYVLAHLAFKNYDPPIIKEGMLFMNTRTDGVAVYEITESLMEKRSKDDIVGYLGYPVQVYIMDDLDNIVASPEEIGLWDENSDDSYRPISVRDMNRLIEEWNGTVEINVFDMSPINAVPLMPAMITGKVILRMPVEAEKEIEEEEEIS